MSYSTRREGGETTEELVGEAGVKEGGGAEGLMWKNGQVEGEITCRHTGTGVIKKPARYWINLVCVCVSGLCELCVIYEEKNNKFNFGLQKKLSFLPKGLEDKSRDFLKLPEMSGNLCVVIQRRFRGLNIHSPFSFNQYYTFYIMGILNRKTSKQ